MTEDEIGPLYCEVMEELKARVQTLHEVVDIAWEEEAWAVIARRPCHLKSV